MSKRVFKNGDRVVFHPSDDFREWAGITGTVVSNDGFNGYRVDLDKRPEGWVLNFMSTADESITWLRHLKPLTPLEQSISDYIKQEKVSLGL